MGEPDEGQACERQEVRTREVSGPIVPIREAIDEHAVGIGEGANHLSKGHHEGRGEEHDEGRTGSRDTLAWVLLFGLDRPWCAFPIRVTVSGGEFRSG